MLSQGCLDRSAEADWTKFCRIVRQGSVGLLEHLRLPHGSAASLRTSAFVRFLAERPLRSAIWKFLFGVCSSFLLRSRSGRRSEELCQKLLYPIDALTVPRADGDNAGLPEFRLELPQVTAARTRRSPSYCRQRQEAGGCQPGIMHSFSSRHVRFENRQPDPRPSLPAMSITKSRSLQRSICRRNSCPRPLFFMSSFDQARNVSDSRSPIAAQSRNA